MATDQQAAVLEYEGTVYLKPVGWGFRLDDINEFIEDALEVLVKEHFEPSVFIKGWSGHASIRIELRP